MRHRPAFSETTPETHCPIDLRMECNAKVSHLLQEIAMTQWPHPQIVTDQSQGVELPMIHTVVPDRRMLESMTEMGAGVLVNDGVGPSAMWQGTPIVFVVDDDASMRESLELLICDAGWQPETFASAQEFLRRERVLVPSCLVLDIDAAGSQRPRFAEASRGRSERHADHLRYGSW